MLAKDERRERKGRKSGSLRRPEKAKGGLSGKRVPQFRPAGLGLTGRQWSVSPLPHHHRSFYPISASHAGTPTRSPSLPATCRRKRPPRRWRACAASPASETTPIQRQRQRALSLSIRGAGAMARRGGKASGRDGPIFIRRPAAAGRSGRFSPGANAAPSARPQAERTGCRRRRGERLGPASLSFSSPLLSLPASPPAWAAQPTEEFGQRLCPGKMPNRGARSEQKWKEKEEGKREKKRREKKAARAPEVLIDGCGRSSGRRAESARPGGGGHR